jgi:hypothetical protein
MSHVARHMSHCAEGANAGRNLHVATEWLATWANWLSGVQA